MSKHKEGFTVPAELQHEFKMLVQRANRRIKANLKYINENNISNEHTIRSIAGSYSNMGNWAGKTMPISRSIKGRYMTNADTGEIYFKNFENRTEFEQYVKHLTKWGEQTKKGELYGAHPKKIKEDYKKAIIKSLNQVKDHYSITLPNGQLPKEVIDEIDSMSLEEITNFFGNGSPDEDMEISQFNSDDFVYVESAQDFIDVVKSRVAMVKKYY